MKFYLNFIGQYLDSILISFLNKNAMHINNILANFIYYMIYYFIKLFNYGIYINNQFNQNLIYIHFRYILDEFYKNI